MQEKKAQISFFIIIAVIALLAFSFIFFMLNEKRDAALNQGNQEKLSSDANLIALKTQGEVCLERELRRALLIAGLRGGFIYDEGESYLPGYLPDSSYSFELIELLNLNWNNLLFRTLVHSKEIVYTPRLDGALIYPKTESEDIVIYKRGIKEDLEFFILDQVLDCLDLDVLEAKGFDVDRELFSGRLQSFDPEKGLADVSKLQGDIGDKVLVSTLNGAFNGKIIKKKAESIEIEFDEKELPPFTEELSEVRVRNLESQAKVTLSFSDETTQAELFLPIRLKDNTGINTLSSIQSSLNIRFKTLLELSSTLLEEKYKDRSLQLENPQDFEEALRRSGRTTTLDLRDLSIERLVVNDSDTEREIVYSLVDKKSKILGVPYTFNFGYENHAPVIDRDPSGARRLNETSLLFVLSQGQELELNLRNVSSDKEYLDNYNSFFLEQKLRTPDADFELFRNGTLHFQGFLEKKYIYQVEVSDGETRRKHLLTILTGFPKNINNTAAKECFTFRNFGIDSLYPLNDEFRNKLFNRSTATGEEVYGLSLYVDPFKQSLLGINYPNSQILFSEACMFSDNLYRAEVTITQRETGEKKTFDLNEETHLFTVEQSPNIQDIEISIYDEELDLLMTEPYKLSIYPSNCLGPYALKDEQLELFGGTLSCCKNDILREAIQSNTPRNFVSESALIEDDSVQLNAEMYFCYARDPSEAVDDSFYANAKYEQEVIWDTFSPDVTSLYTGRVIGVCNGLLAVPQFKEVKATGSIDFDSEVAKLYGILGTFDFPLPLSFKLTKVQDAEKCEFCSLEHHAGIEMLANSGELFDLGFVLANSQVGDVSVGAIPLGLGFNDILFLKERGEFASENILNDSSWKQGIVGKDSLEPEFIFKGKSYCAQGDETQNRFDSIESQRDDEPQCRDWFFNGTAFSFQDNTGWSCGENNLGTCQNGVCIMPS